MEIPPGNNVYGLLDCEHRLPELARLLRTFLGLGEAGIHIKSSQQLLFGNESFEFEVYPTDTNGEYLFNGAVAGDDQEVCAFVQTLHDALRGGGFHPRFEVYDPNGRCLAELGA